MFEKIKLNLYKDKLVGFTWDYHTNDIFGADITIYLVILKNNKYKFINYSKITVFNQQEIKKLLEYFNNHNITFITNWSNESLENKISYDSGEAVLKLVKSIPIERRNL